MDTQHSTQGNICALPAVHKQWSKLLGEYGMLYQYGMTGFGKTTQALCFAKAVYKESTRISAAEDDFWDALQTAAHTKQRAKTLLIIDNLQWLLDDASRTRLFEQLLTLRRIRGLHVMLISRAAPPAYLMPLQVTRQLAVCDQELLRFTADTFKALIQTYPTLAALPAPKRDKLTDVGMQTTSGHAVSINALCQRLEKTPDDMQTAIALATQDVFDFVTIHLFNEWTLSRRDSAVRLSVFEQFDSQMAEKLLGTGYADILRDFLEVGSFLTFKAPDTYTFVPFFHQYLNTQLKKRPRDEWLPLYETAAECCVQRRKYAQALSCWKQAGRDDKIADIVVYLSENAEGCTFASTAQEYIEQLSPEWEQREPRLLGAKVMLAAYRMQTDECLALLERLKQSAEAERKCVMRSGAMEAYVRTVIACPFDTADKLKDNMLLYADYVRQNGFHVKNIMPTGNMPSLINGGLDLLPWNKNRAMLYPVIKAAAELIMGRDAVGIADASMGEILYEQNDKTKSMAYLTKALSAANYHGSIRVQYAVTAIMSRLFQSEGQADTAEDILQNVRQKADAEHFTELLPNIDATLVHCALLKRDMPACEAWLEHKAPNEYEQFYITMREQLYVKAQVYIAMEKTMEALHILNLLENFAKIYHRTYFNIEVLVLKAIVLYRRDEPWQQTLDDALDMARPYALVRVFADQGAALLPLWKQLEAPDAVITKEIKQMAAAYPNYLKPPHKYGELSAKECEVLSLMADGCSNGQIAEILDVNLGTVKFHVANIMKKLDAENRTVAVKTAQEEGLLK